MITQLANSFVFIICIGRNKGLIEKQNGSCEATGYHPATAQEDIKLIECLGLLWRN